MASEVCRGPRRLRDRGVSEQIGDSCGAHAVLQTSDSRAVARRVNAHGHRRQAGRTLGSPPEWTFFIDTETGKARRSRDASRQSSSALLMSAGP